MLNIKNMGTLKGLTRAMRAYGYELTKMVFDAEVNELTIKYDNENTSEDYVWEVTVEANVQEEEYDGVPTIIDITRVSMENTGALK